jgi:hypothetical protein
MSWGGGREEFAFYRCDHPRALTEPLSELREPCGDVGLAEPQKHASIIDEDGLDGGIGDADDHDLTVIVLASDADRERHEGFEVVPDSSVERAWAQTVGGSVGQRSGTSCGHRTGCDRPHCWPSLRPYRRSGVRFLPPRSDRIAPDTRSSAPRGGAPPALRRRAATRALR